MPKPINITDAKSLQKTIKDVLDKYKSKDVVNGYGKVRGKFKRIQADEYEFTLNIIMKKISDLIA